MQTMKMVFNNQGRRSADWSLYIEYRIYAQQIAGAGLSYPISLFFIQNKASQDGI